MKPAMLKRTEAADYLNISLSQLQRLLDAGRLPYIDLGMRSRRKPMIPRAALDRWIEQNTRAAA